MFWYNYPMRHYLAALYVVLLFAIPWLSFNYPDRVNGAIDAFENDAVQLAAIITHNPRTVAGLQSKYNVVASTGLNKIRVLIVPGHEPDYGGAEFGSITERNLVVTLADNLADFLT